MQSPPAALRLLHNSPASLELAKGPTMALK
jgi:hypothetical protein